MFFQLVCINPQATAEEPPGVVPLVWNWSFEWRLSLHVLCGSYLRVCDAYSIVKSHHSVSLSIGLGKQALSCSFDHRVCHKHPETQKQHGDNKENGPEVSWWSIQSLLTFGSRKDQEAEYGWRYRWMWTCRTSTQDLKTEDVMSMWQLFTKMPLSI